MERTLREFQCVSPQRRWLIISPNFQAKSTPNAIKVNVTAEREDYVPDSSRGGSMVFDRKSESLPV